MYLLQATRIVGGARGCNCTVLQWIVSGVGAENKSYISDSFPSPPSLPIHPPPNSSLIAHAGGPSERAMVLAQIRNKAFLSVVRETGLQGLFVGFSATLYRDVSYNVVFFPSREILIKWFTLYYQEKPDPWTRLLLGYPPGILAAIVSCPFDVVKTRIQGNELGN